MPEVNRLTSALTTSTYATSPSHCWGEVYNPDPWGNLNSIAATTNSNYTGCSEESGFSATADGNNHFNIFSYDSSGNTQSDGSISYTWDAESQLKTAAGVTYTYDGDGRRASKVGSKLYWYGSGGDILAETDASGNTTAEYIFFGGKRVAMLPAGGNPIYYIEDLLGTSRVITTNTGTVCYDADFYPYGGERAYTNTCPQNYKFEGKERDTETGNDDFGARYYSNRFGRWLSADWSSVPAPVPYANLTNPQTLNLYAMVADDPESFADLDGHETAATAPPTQSNGCTGDPKNCTVHPASEDIDQQQGKPTEQQSGAQRWEAHEQVTPEKTANALKHAGEMGDAGVKAGLVVVGAEAAVAGAVVAAPTVGAAASQAGTAINTATTSAYVQTTAAISAAGAALRNGATTAGNAINNAATTTLNFAKQTVVTIDTLKSGGGAINAAANFVQGYRASTSLAPRQPPPQNSAGAAGFLVGVAKRLILP